MLISLDDITLHVDEHGTGRPVLLLHGGAGPASVGGFAALLAGGGDLRVLAPTHPGFNGTERPASLTDIRGLARLYARLLDELDLSDVLVIGSSIGGWTAAELAALGSPRITRLVLVDAVGLDVPEHPVADFFALSFPELARLSYADPEKFRIDPEAMSPEARETMAGNRATLAVYASTMTDPTLRGRLASIGVPTLVVWGEADGIVTPAYGKEYAAAIPGAHFAELPGAGHMPQLETPGLLLAAVREQTD
ncbi:alpha/beta fold hydrolase [Symbioplanes lichenis]|uniref:alpha/beta fold hydrolase n=1 Tax=Symbioplanes lichenis TaxID=1629072 RepID=UPI002738D382|nr:alpha/beta hydrolase [Actinoplanes lichenis]